MFLHSQYLPFEKNHEPQILFMFFNTLVCCMFYFVYPLGRYHIFVLWSGNYLSYIILYDGLVFFCHGICPFFLLNVFFKESRFIFYEITHQGHIAAEWIRFISFSLHLE
jgi:hypothetical protein